MKRLFYIQLLLALLASLTMISTIILADPPSPRTPPHPPFTPAQPGDIPPKVTPFTPRALDLPPLTAVLIVGPIDGDDGHWTVKEKQNMDLAATELEANGVTVHRFYTPNNNWEQIIAAAEGAQFLFYRGHGVYWSAMPHPDVGGFALKSTSVSADDIRNDLHLAPHAIVMLYGCFTAGSSGNDETSIDSAEARRRVAQYSKPFLDVGVTGYYADWFGDAFQKYVRYLFQGQTLGEAYKTFYDFNSNTAEYYTHPDYPDSVLWLDKDYWYDPKPQYNNAFVGTPDLTIEDLFRVTSMQVNPASVAYLAEPSFPARTFVVKVDAVGSETFNWTASVISVAINQIDVASLTGSNGQALSVTLTPTATLGIYTATIRIVSDNPDIQNRDQIVPVILRIVSHVYATYLPIVFR